jgi:catechol 2,3-dioxygenase-like lactoylglutathione lyase family enzyme
VDGISGAGAMLRERPNFLRETMLSHIHIGINDFDRALSFYSPIMKALNLELKFSDPSQSWAGWMSPEQDRPLFLIGLPFDRLDANPGNGNMTAFLASTREVVDQCHALALSLGGTDEGAPGLRPQYHANYYGAYFRDLEGNKICVCCHDPE